MHTFIGAVAAVWMGFLSLFGFFTHHVPPPLPQGQESAAYGQASSTPELQGGPAQIPQGAPQGQGETSRASDSNTSSNSAPAPSIASTGLPATGSAWETTLPLGDYHYTTSGPEKGYIYLCHVAQGGEGAQGNPAWISGNVWYLAQKVAVEGSVSWPNAFYSMTLSGADRIIKSNGLPTDHDTGTFPISPSDPAYQFDRNPNSIEAQNYDFTLPANPTTLATPGCIYGEVGIMNDGVPLFDGFDAEYRDAVAHETQDAWEGHPDESGVYHNHGFEAGPVKDPVSQVVGFAFDGFPITGSRLPDGTYLHTADLDECHGLTSTITLDGKSVTMYHYVLTQDFPYSVSCFRGESHEPKPGPAQSQTSSQNAPQNQQQISGAQNGGSPPAPPHAAIDACAGKSSGAACSVSGGPSGTCAEIDSTLACKPSR